MTNKVDVTASIGMKASDMGSEPKGLYSLLYSNANYRSTESKLGDCGNKIDNAF